MLNAITMGDPANPPLVIAHGLFGSAKNWRAMSRRLSDKWYVISVDMRNHGDSKFYSEHNYEVMADDLKNVLKFYGGYCSVLGHSMGGKAFMYLALEEPNLVNKLIVVDIAPVNYQHSQIEIIKALQSVDLKTVKSRRDVNDILSSQIKEKTIRSFLLQSLKFQSAAVWDLNLPILAQDMEKIMNFPSFDQTFNGETLLLVGADSGYVSKEDISFMRKNFLNLSVEKITGSGHWVHIEKPEEFEIKVRRFLTS